MSKYGGLLGFVSEACDIEKELGCTAEESFKIQRERADERERLWMADQEQLESNVLQFRPRGC
jgi:hypothetical protein